jgi:D-sedoheptulose 7-phosphate isomerase
MNFSLVTAPSAYLAAFSRLLERVETTTGDGASVPFDQALGGLVNALVELKSSGGKVLLIGNGGSAAIVSHVQNDLCKVVGVRALVFNEAPLLTAVANDHGYHQVFHKPVDLWADERDLLIAVSSSGESENIVKAAARAKDKGCRVVTFTGFAPGNRLRQIGDVNIYVPDSAYGYVENAHQLIAHCVIDLAVLTSASV